VTVEKRRIATSGGEISYVEAGDGPPVLLLHGFPLSSYLWRDIVPLLSTRFRVIAPDLPGAGDSEVAPGAPLGIRAQADSVRELLHLVGVETFAAVGHSSGGGVAQLLALGGSVDAMVLIDSVAFDGWPSSPTRRVQRTSPNLEGAELVEVEMRATLRQGMGDPDRLPEVVIQEYLRPYRSPEGVSMFFRAARALNGRGLTGHEAAMSAWTFPVLILWGEEDPFLSWRLGERLNEAIPSSTLGLLPGCGHYLLEDAIETVGPMIHEYLRARYEGAPHGHEGVVMLQLERRPPWVDLAEYEQGDNEPRVPEAGEQEVGPNA
jgi:pimeloyl-ACP methyl ester carboxylesterase